MRLCPTCQAARTKWRQLHYDPRRPTQWPGGQHILDARTSHQERRRDWETKTAQQVQLIESICARQHLTERLLQIA